MIKKISYKDHAEWMKIRSQYIGGSDAGTIMGMNPYSSKYYLWCEKTGKIGPKEQTNAMRDGTYLEQMVADYFCDVAGKKVQKCNFTLVNEEYPWACANVDRMLVGEDAILECKTTSSFPNMQKFKTGEFPDQWYCQCMHYLAVTGKKKAYLAAYDMVHRELYIFELERDEAEIASLMASEKSFMEGVYKNIPPALDGSEATGDALNAIYDMSNPDAAKVDLFGFSEQLAHRKQIMDMIKELDEQKKTVENQIKLAMGEAETGGIDEWSVSWKPQSRKSINWKGLEAAGLMVTVAPFIEESCSRVLRITEKGARKK